MGALFIQNGIGPIQDWMTGIIDPNSEPPLPPSPSPATLQLNPPAYQSGTRGPYTPQPPAGPPPPLPSPPPPDTNQATAQPTSTITVALVNQIASQKACKIEYVAESVGPPHQPIWTVRCKSAWPVTLFLIRDQYADVLQSMAQKKEWARGRTRRLPKKRPRNKHILRWVGGVGESERLEKIDGSITNRADDGVPV